MIKYFNNIDPYYQSTGNNFKLIRIIPALDSTDSKAHCYFSCPSINDCEYSRLSPIFLQDNTILYSKSTEENYRKDIYGTFIFDTEYYMLEQSYTKKKKTIPNLIFKDTAKHIIENPVVLFFQGCDDGHVGLRFGTIDAANSFIDNLEVFEDVFNNTLFLNEDDKQAISELKASTGEDISPLLQNVLQYHN